MTNDVSLVEWGAGWLDGLSSPTPYDRQWQTPGPDGRNDLNYKTITHI